MNQKLKEKRAKDSVRQLSYRDGNLFPGLFGGRQAPFVS